MGARDCALYFVWFSERNLLNYPVNKHNSLLHARIYCDKMLYMSLRDLWMRIYIARREKYANYDLRYEEVTVERNIRYGDRKSQTFSLYRKSAKPLPTFIYFHGGALAGRNKNCRRAFCTELAKMGLAVLNVEYRGEVNLGAKECLKEAETILAFLKEHYSSLALNLDKLFIGGDELGAYIASYLGSQVEKYDLRPLGIVLFSGFYDAIRHAKGNSYYSTQYRFIKKFFKIDLKKAHWDSSVSNTLADMSVIRRIDEEYPPTFICHSVYDEFMPEQGNAMVKALKQKNVYCFEFKAVFEKEYHNFQLNRKSLSAKAVKEYLTTFIEEALDGGIYRNEHREI